MHIQITQVTQRSFKLLCYINWPKRAIWIFTDLFRSSCHKIKNAVCSFQEAFLVHLGNRQSSALVEAPRQFHLVFGRSHAS